MEVTLATVTRGLSPRPRTSFEESGSPASTFRKEGQLRLHLLLPGLIPQIAGMSSDPTDCSYELAHAPLAFVLYCRRGDRARHSVGVEVQKALMIYFTSRKVSGYR